VPLKIALTKATIGYSRLSLLSFRRAGGADRRAKHCRGARNRYDLQKVLGSIMASDPHESPTSDDLVTSNPEVLGGRSYLACMFTMRIFLQGDPLRRPLPGLRLCADLGRSALSRHVS
jgi:hypothetical protein